MKEYSELALEFKKGEWFIGWTTQDEKLAKELLDMFKANGWDAVKYLDTWTPPEVTHGN